MDGLESRRLLVKVATLYYESNLTQNEIAEILGISRPKVSRVLDQARAEGVVQISVRPYCGIHVELERALETRYGIREAVVVEAQEGESAAGVRRALAGAAGGYLLRILQPGQTVGVTWGRTLAQVIGSLPTTRIRDVTVVQATGGLGESSGESHATGIATRLAWALGARLSLLPAPGIVDTPELREALLQDSHVRGSLEALEGASLLLMGIGIPSRDSVLVESGAIVEWSELQGLVEQGCVGDVALHFFDHEGRPVPGDMRSRVITVSQDTIRRIPRSVGVAGGPDKVPAIRAALLGKWVNTLVTDDATARALLEEAAGSRVRETARGTDGLGPGEPR